MKKVAVVGLGYVGLPLALEFGKMRSVVGYDIDCNRVKLLQNGHDITRSFSAKDLSEASLLSFTHRIGEISDCELFIVTVPTPVDAVNRPCLEPLLKVSEAIGSILKKGDIVIYESTVYPGVTEEVCAPVLEKSSGLKFNEDFFCGYSPERINPGDGQNTLTTIKKLTSGSTAAVAAEVDKLYSAIISAGTVSIADIKVAEAAKVIENCQRDLNIAFVNELSMIFQLMDIDTTEVLKAAGSKWNFLPFKPGMVGGHCISVDPYYLIHKAEEVGYSPQLICAGRRVNNHMPIHVAQNVVRLMLKNGMNLSQSTVAVLGATFKENCSDMRNSQVTDLIEELVSWNLRVVVRDPMVEKGQLINGHKIFSGDVGEKVDAVIVAVAHDEFRGISTKNLREMCRGDMPIVADVKSIYDKQQLISAGFTVFRL